MISCHSSAALRARRPVLNAEGIETVIRPGWLGHSSPEGLCSTPEGIETVIRRCSRKVSW